MTEINTARSFLSELWRALVSLPQPAQKTPGFCFRRWHLHINHGGRFRTTSAWVGCESL